MEIGGFVPSPKLPEQSAIWVQTHPPFGVDLRGNTFAFGAFPLHVVRFGKAISIPYWLVTEYYWHI